MEQNEVLNGGSRVKTILFPRLHFTTLECRKFLKLHGYIPYMRVERSDTDYIYTINPNKFTHYITRFVENNVKIRYGFF